MEIAWLRDASSRGAKGVCVVAKRHRRSARSLAAVGDKENSEYREKIGQCTLELIHRRLGQKSLSI
jgi:hypothetical protein